MRLLNRLLVLSLLVLACAGVDAAERTTYFVPDAQGSPVAAMDEQGNVLWRESYAPYGNRQVKAPANPASPAYTGKPEDVDTGLVYMGARWYDPETARFTGVDPQGFSEGNPQSFGRYVYANNSPYRYVDPNGEVAVPAVIAGLVVATGYVARDVSTSVVLSSLGLPDIPFSLTKLSTSVAKNAVKGDVISGPTVLWAGGNAAKNGAKKLADEVGGKTLAMTSQGQRAALNTAGKPYAETRGDWAEVSRQLAEEANGMVHVVMNSPAVKNTSILLTDEIPTALRNANVRSFMFHKVDP